MRYRFGGEMSAALAVRRSEWEPISQSHQGQRHEPHEKSGCTGAIYPSNHHELIAWQTGASMYGQGRGHLIFISGTSGIVSIRSNDFTICSVPVLYLRK